MASNASTISHVLDAGSAAGTLSARKMFGEYAIYLDGKVVALVCDDALFLKPLPEALALAPDLPTGVPYPGAKPHLDGDGLLDEPEKLARVLRAIADALPTPKPKKRSGKAPSA